MPHTAILRIVPTNLKSHHFINFPAAIISIMNSQSQPWQHLGRFYFILENAHVPMIIMTKSKTPTTARSKYNG